MLVLARSLVHESMMCNEGWDSIYAVASRMIWSSFKPIWLLPAYSISGTCKGFQVIEMSMSWYCSWLVPFLSFTNSACLIFLTFMIHPFLSDETDMHDFSRGTIAILVGETANTSISIEQSYVVFSSHNHQHWNTFNLAVSWKACKLKFISWHKNVKNIDMFLSVTPQNFQFWVVNRKHLIK